MTEAKMTQPMKVETTKRKTALTVLEWIGSLFLLTVPLVNVMAAFLFIVMRKKSEDRSNYMLALLLLLLSIAIMAISCYVIFGSYLIDWLKLWLMQNL